MSDPTLLELLIRVEALERETDILRNRSQIQGEAIQTVMETLGVWPQGDYASVAARIANLEAS